ncbi:aspartate carbamoyltransferase [Microbulbifer sp. ANSA003]|uniref:aspartate/ornithine carbamoyltransferase family protein n=1 Tax=Microbulbifer sp. ANSA003 TaxID=3243360 RepID=UPI004041CD8B
MMTSAPFDKDTNLMAKALVEAIPEQGRYLESLTGKSLISSSQLNRDGILQLLRLAARCELDNRKFSCHLNNKILISAFFESSTRTRLSFESAWLRLGGSTVSITDKGTTRIGVGESLRDVAEMVSNYGDCVVLRDSSEDSVKIMSNNLSIPIINAGNGIDEHPTQSLIDLYALLKWNPSILSGKSRKISIGLIGAPARMRAARSLLILMSCFPEFFSEVFVLCDEEEQEPFRQAQLSMLQEKGLKISLTDKIGDILPRLDVVYMNAISLKTAGHRDFGSGYFIDNNSPLKKQAIVLHPLPRMGELDSNLDDTPHNWYFIQAKGGVYVRMALAMAICGRPSEIVDIA